MNQLRIDHIITTKHNTTLCTPYAYQYGVYSKMSQYPQTQQNKAQHNCMYIVCILWYNVNCKQCLSTHRLCIMQHCHQVKALRLPLISLGSTQANVEPQGINHIYQWHTVACIRLETSSIILGYICISQVDEILLIYWTHWGLNRMVNMLLTYWYIVN